MNRLAAHLPARHSSSSEAIGRIRRRSYDPATGEARWFVSGWDSSEGGTPQVRSNM
jgi:hypothetical protein